MTRRPFSARYRRFVQVCIFFALLLTAACTPSEMPEAATATPTQPPPSAQETPQTSPPATPSTEIAAEQIEALVLDPQDGAAPVRLNFPGLNVEIEVETMGWRIALIDGERTTVWNLPESAAGWHRNSGMPGTPGNVVISGHQLLGSAVFAPIALGEVGVGEEIRLTDFAGRTFVYQVEEVSEPVPIPADLGQEKELAAQYVDDQGRALLTLVAGWPDFSTTHRIFVRAEYVGVLTP